MCLYVIQNEKDVDSDVSWIVIARNGLFSAADCFALRPRPAPRCAGSLASCSLGGLLPRRYWQLLPNQPWGEARFASERLYA